MLVIEKPSAAFEFLRVWRWQRPLLWIMMFLAFAPHAAEKKPTAE
jgi:hypothetical protein